MKTALTLTFQLKITHTAFSSTQHHITNIQYLYTNMNMTQNA